jgi:protein SCO1/2
MALTDSIFFYLMDPLGQFVDAFGKNTTADEVATKTKEAMVKWEKAGGNAAAGVPEKQASN